MTLLSVAPLDHILAQGLASRACTTVSGRSAARRIRRGRPAGAGVSAAVAGAGTRAVNVAWLPPSSAG